MNNNKKNRENKSKKTAYPKLIKIYVTDEEKKQIQKLAYQDYGISISSLGKKILLNYTPTSRIDQKAFDEIIRISANYRKTGGLLKLTLTQQQNQENQELLKQALRKTIQQQKEINFFLKELGEKMNRDS